MKRTEGLTSVLADMQSVFWMTMLRCFVDLALVDLQPACACATGIENARSVMCERSLSDAYLGNKEFKSTEVSIATR